MFYISRFLLKPYVILFFTNAIAFFAWSFPSFDVLRKGFDIPHPLISFGAFSYFLSLTIIFLFSYLAYKFSKRIFHVKYMMMDFNRCMVSNRIFAFSLFISSIGFLAALLGVVKKATVVQLFSFISLGQANEIKYLLYEDYSIGFVSLRYCIIISASFLLYRRLNGVRSMALDLITVVLLLFSSLISSRLTFIASIVGGIYLFLFFKRKIRVNFLKTSIIIFSVFFILSLLNWSRNSNYYEARELSFFSGGVSEIITYLGSPVQGAMTAFEYESEVSSLDTFYRLSTIEENLNTNSSFHIYISKYGYVGVFWLVLFITLISFVIGAVEEYQSGRFIFVNIPLIYSLAEFWRLPLFSEGIIITLVVCAIIICVVDKYKLKV